MKKAIISLYHDTRRELEDGKFPVKLRAYFGTAKLYETGIFLTIEEFDHSYHEKSPRGRFKEIQISLKAIEAKGIEAANANKFFSFQKFERALFRNKDSITNVIDHYCERINDLEGNEQIGYASNFRCSMNSILSFANTGKGNPISVLKFEQITPEFLEKYERWMVDRELSRTSVGIYLRPLRKLYNDAIANGDINPDLYPFKKYKIPTGKNIKKNIEKDVMKSLFTIEVDDLNVEKARAFWFFSYQCNGMNFRDIAELKFKNLAGSYFSFIRYKTRNTTKEDPTPIVVPITPSIKSFIKKYGRKNGNNNDYIFPIFEVGMSAKERHRINQNFIRFVNQHMKKLAISVGIEFNLGTMYARHSFTTRVTRELGLEFAQEALGHTTIVTTQNYWAGFETTVKKQMAEKLLDFG
ncbi:tyrosine-type recombinase/integrase [Pedobacter lithocola]|uniref:Tyrosine-type recombinase/integrase n=1 Tax=Pedobacter lithocola TaxID=1908239 RepID=A0ABV8PGN3_9SPHI